MNLEALVCEYEGCNLIYENPVTLTCGNSLCLQHLEKFDEKLKCPFCFDEHQVPPINKVDLKKAKLKCGIFLNNIYSININFYYYYCNK